MWPFTRSKARGADVKRADDVVWLTSEARAGGVIAQVDRALAGGSHIVVTGHHAPTVEAACALLTDEPRALELVSAPMTAPLCARWLQSLEMPTCIVVNARWLTPTAAAGGDRQATAITFMVLGRHPLRRFDDELLVYANQVSPGADVVFQVAMDDPLMKAFSGETQVAVLKRLGMTERESITHPFLTRSITRAQAKVAQQVQRTGEHRIDGFEPLTRAHLEPTLHR